MTREITLDQAINNYPSLVDELTYSCYRYNRMTFPNTTPEKWKAVFSNVDGMEHRFQAETQTGNDRL